MTRRRTDTLRHSAEEPARPQPQRNVTPSAAQPANTDRTVETRSASPEKPNTRRRRPSLILSLLASLSGAVILTVFALSAWVGWSMIKPIEPGADVYEIAAGQSLSQFGDQLVERGVIDETLTLRVWAKVTGVGRQIKLGRYQLSEQTRLLDIINQLVEGDVITQQIALIEGHSFRQFRQTLNRESDLVQTLDGVTDLEILQRLGSDRQHPEGLFFPDTYEYVTGSTDFEILQRAYERMTAKLDEAWQQRRGDVPLQSAYEALILASIVEKETGAAEERPRIAGVFVNRLRTGMRLQTDPTVIYGLGDSFDGNLTRKHLVTDNEYNTYTRGGLPPTPIANPGNDALLAVVQPATTTEIFFVSRGDGTHEFSDTLEQHNDAVDKYQRKRSSKQ